MLFTIIIACIAPYANAEEELLSKLRRRIDVVPYTAEQRIQVANIVKNLFSVTIH